MKNIVEIIKSLPKVLLLKPAEENQIIDAENQLNLKFSNEYREYLFAFGAVIADGIELTGITNAEYLNVVFLTKQEWKLNSKVSHNMYVIENTCIDGIIIWQDANGIIYKSRPNLEPERIADSLVDYIKIL